MAVLTTEEVRAKGLCAHDKEAFAAAYGEGGEVTVEKAVAHAQTFDWLDASVRLLTPRQQQTFKVLFLQRGKGLNGTNDRDQSKRRVALAFCFATAYNSPKE